MVYRIHCTVNMLQGDSVHTVENGGTRQGARGAVHKVEGGPQGLERKQDVEAKLGATE